MSTMRAGLSGYESLFPEIRRHAEANIDYFTRHRRFLRFVDTRQKWLLAHLIARTCHDAADGMMGGAAANWICERAASLGVASRNTSLAFFSQLAAYGYLDKRDHSGDRRIKLMSLSAGMETALADWTRMLVEAATDSDAGALDHEALMRIYLDMMAGLLDDPKWVRAPLDICLTQDMRGGWLVMSEILRHLPRGAAAEEAWIPAAGLSIPAMTLSFGLSRSTLYRLVRASVEAGIMVWAERQAVSTLMINRYHVRQYSRWIGLVLQAAAASHAGAVDARPRGAAIGADRFHAAGMADAALAATAPRHAYPGY